MEQQNKTSFTQVSNHLDRDAKVTAQGAPARKDEPDAKEEVLRSPQGKAGDGVEHGSAGTSLTRKRKGAEPGKADAPNLPNDEKEGIERANAHVSDPIENFSEEDNGELATRTEHEETSPESTEPVPKALCIVKPLNLTFPETADCDSVFKSGQQSFFKHAPGDH